MYDIYSLLHALNSEKEEYRQTKWTIEACLQIAYKQFEKIKRNARSVVPIERILPYMKVGANDSDSSGYSENDNVSRRRGDDTVSMRGMNKTKEQSAVFNKNRGSQRDPNESHNNRNSDMLSEMSDNRRSEFQSKKNFQDEDESIYKIQVKCSSNKFNL